MCRGYLHCTFIYVNMTVLNQHAGGSVVVDFLFIVTPIVGACNCPMFILRGAFGKFLAWYYISTDLQTLSCLESF